MKSNDFSVIRCDKVKVLLFKLFFSGFVWFYCKSEEFEVRVNAEEEFLIGKSSYDP